MDYLGTELTDDGDVLHNYGAFLASIDGQYATAINILIEDQSETRAQFVLDQVMLERGLHEIVTTGQVH